MQKLNSLLAGLLFAGLGLAVSPVADAAGAVATPSPLQRCVSESWHKVYTRADADFDLVRERLERELAGPAEGVRVRGLDPRRVPVGTSSFSVTLELRRCESLPPGPGAWSAPVASAACNEVGCGDPAPGTNAPEGSLLVIESCEGGKRTTAVYERKGGRWVLVEYEQVRSTHCGPLGGG